MSTYGAGIAFFLPVTAHRYFLPWRPISGATGGYQTSLTLKVALIFGRELLWIWVPSILLIILLRWRRGRAR
jgi:inner membrane protein